MCASRVTCVTGPVGCLVQSFASFLHRQAVDQGVCKPAYINEGPCSHYSTDRQRFGFRQVRRDSQGTHDMASGGADNPSLFANRTPLRTKVMPPSAGAIVNKYNPRVHAWGIEHKIWRRSVKALCVDNYISYDALGSALLDKAKFLDSVHSGGKSLSLKEGEQA